MNVSGPARIVADLMDDLDPERFERACSPVECG
jgi:hypothetical protein